MVTLVRTSVMSSADMPMSLASPMAVTVLTLAAMAS